MKFCSDLEFKNQVAELEHGLQVQPDADPVNPCRRHGKVSSFASKHESDCPQKQEMNESVGKENDPTTERNQVGSEPPAFLPLTVLRLPPLQLPLGLKGGDDVLNQVAVGVAIAIVRQPRVTREAFLLLLVEDVKPSGSVARRHSQPEKHVKGSNNRTEAEE